MPPPKPQLKIQASADEPYAMLAGDGEPALGKKASFVLSSAGAFKTREFVLDRSGISLAGGEANVVRQMSTDSRCSSLDEDYATDPRRGAPDAAPDIDIRSFNELDILPEEIGTGEGGIVHEARHTPTGSRLAVKRVDILVKEKRHQIVAEGALPVPEVGPLALPLWCQYLRPTCVTVRNMRAHSECPWLVRMYNAFYDDAKVYMAMELMCGGSLEELVEAHRDSGMRDEVRLARIAADILNGLHHLHMNCHQMHRDLKPANVLLSAEGRAKISDFGISAQLDSIAGSCHEFVGTTCYMSPERLSADAYSYSADIWSAGLIFLELMIGRYPYPPTDNNFVLVAQIQDGEAPRVPDNGGFSAEISEFVHVALVKEPTARPSASQLLTHPWLRCVSTPDEGWLSGLMAKLQRVSLRSGSFGD